MHRPLWPVLLLILSLTPLAGCRSASPPANSAGVSSTFRIWSPDFEAGGWLPASSVYTGFGCDGANVSPALRWSGVPEGTRSVAVTLYDPDAPTGSGWWHWAVVDLPPTAEGLPAGAGSEGGALPTGAAQGRTDFGTVGYGGPCPPEGDDSHRYVFTLYALDVPTLSVPTDVSVALVGFQLNAHAITRATLTGRYGR